MKDLTCIIIGGGHAGIHAAKAIMKESRENGRRLRLILIDKQPYHLRKVLLFKPAAGDEEITVPWASMFPDGIDFIQGTVTTVDSGEKRVRYQDAEGNERLMNYDILVVAIGSIVRQPDPNQGGIALTGLEAAASIRERWRANLRKAAAETNAKERERLLTVAVAGAGISGIEASAELAHAMREEAKALGLDPAAVRVYLLNAQDRLFQEGPAKVGHKLEQSLADCGVTVLHQRKALQEKDGRLILSDGAPLLVGLCVWTLGLLPNPHLGRIGLPLTPEGQVMVDQWYRVKGAPSVYSIGDCARIVDPASGRPDRMTCKEATFQAVRLGSILFADLDGRPAPAHKGVIDLFCIGLGPEKGLLWVRKWGLDMIMMGKLAGKVKKYTWDSASLLK